MPTIDQLAPATSSSDTDEFIVSQGGIARKVTRAQVLNGVQPQLTVPAGTLLGGVGPGLRAPSPVTVGANLMLNGSTLSATATPFSIKALPSGMVPKTSDLVAMSQNGTSVAVTYGQLLGGISGSPNVDVSQATVKPAGTNTASTLATLIGKLLPISGGSLTGALALAGSPTSLSHAASKGYVDGRIAGALPISGGSLTGVLTLAGAPVGRSDAATKSYVDAIAANNLSLAGGSLSGALTLAANPITPLQAATKQYADLRVSRAGDTLTGALTLAGSPQSAMQAANKSYVDASVATTLPLAGGTMLGALYLASDPALAGQAATKQYADQRVLRAGDTLTGFLTLSGSPSQSLHAATKGYVDTQLGATLARSGGTMSGSLVLATDPTVPLEATTKQYADTKISRSGDSLTGALYLNSAPTSPMQAATKGYVDSAALATTFQAGGSFAGSLYLAGDPVSPLQAVTKRYSDSHVSRAGDTMTGTLLLASDPTTPSQAATKNYVDIQIAGTLPRTGGSLTGSLLLNADPTSASQASTKHYVDAQIATALPLAGGSITGFLSLSATPQNALHAANKAYVDTQVTGRVAASGGSLTDALTLAGLPTSPLQAATKSYVDANPTAARVINVCLPPYNAALNGATDDTAAFKAAYAAAAPGSVIYVPNGTAVLQPPGNWGIALTKNVKWIVDGTVLASGTPLASAIPGGVGPASLILPGVVVGNTLSSSTTSQGSSSATDFAVNHSAYIVNHSGGNSGVISNARTDTIIYNSPANYVWNALDRLVWAGTQTPYGIGTAQHVGRYVQTVRETASTGSQGQNLPQPQLWAACLEYHDMTGQPSSVTNAALTVEMDWYGNGLDDANCRAVQSLVIGQANTSGPPVEVTDIIGVWLGAGSSGSAKTVLNVNVPFSSSVVDSTNAQSINNAPVIKMAAGQAIAFEQTNTNRLAYNSSSNVLYWYQGTTAFPVGKGISVGYASIYQSSTTLPNTLSGGIIFLIGSSAFTVTLPPANTVAAGTGFTFSSLATAGVSITPSGKDAIDSGPIILHTNDRYHIVSDGAGAWHEVFWTNAVSPRFLGPVILPSYAVSALPGGVVAGAKAFASNGRKPGEAAGAGTGVEVFFDGQHWISSCSGITVAA